MPRHVKKGDTVQIISGDDRGKQGRVLQVLPKSNRVVVEGINRVYRHVRRSRTNPQGGRLEKEAAIHISNVQPVVSGRPTRVGFRAEDDGSKHRVARGRHSHNDTSLGVVSKKSSQ
jgi:large subunit ribosomal protein L24